MCWKLSLKLWDTILEIWRPSKEARLVAELTLLLIAGIWTLPLWAPIVNLNITDQVISTLRAVATPWLLLFAMPLILYLVLRAKNSSIARLPWKFHEKKTLSIGSYYNVLTKKGEQFVRITFKDISQQKMPPPYESPDSTPEEIKTEVATIGFTPSYFVSHGYRVKKISTLPFLNESCFYMCKKENDEISDSAFLFNTDHKVYEYFFRCYVDHINPAKKEVELDIFFIWLNPENP